MKTWTVLLVALLLAACASAPLPPPVESLFKDGAFGPASERIGASDLFAMSPEMKQYMTTTIAPVAKAKGAQQGLFEALYSRGQLKLEYDSAKTRNAAQAFAARSGNCLSLVIMTAAFAKEMGLPVTYVVLNNERYAAVGAALRRFGGLAVEHDDFPGIDIAGPRIADISTGFGVPGKRVDTLTDLRESLEAARTVDHPTLIEVMTDPTHFGP